MSQNTDLLQQMIRCNQMPPILYKYRSIKNPNHLDSLNTNSFLFATAKSFNDPFDSNLSEVKNYDSDELHIFLKNYSNEPYAVKKLTVSEIDSFILRNDREPSEIVKIFTESRTKIVNERGILSLSKNFNNILMWSHYAENHTGMVIGLSLEQDIDFFITPIIVDYKNEYKPLNYIANPDESIIDNFKTKSELWSYEEEIRIIKNESGLHEFNKNIISEIRFGCRAEEKDIQNVMNLCNAKGYKNIKFYKSEMVYASFKLDFIRI